MSTLQVGGALSSSTFSAKSKAVSFQLLLIAQGDDVDARTVFFFRDAALSTSFLGGNILFPHHRLVDFLKFPLGCRPCDIV